MYELSPDKTSHSLPAVLGLTVLYYDHLLTFGREVSHIWPQPTSINTLLFFFNRYVAFIGNIGAAVLLLAGLGDSVEPTVFCVRTEGMAVYSCNLIARVRELILVVNQVGVAVILTTRIIALYNNSYTAIIGVVGFGLTLAGITSWALFGGHRSTPIISGSPGCHFVFSNATAFRLATAWEAQALFDAMVFALTVMRSLKMRKMHNMEISLTGEGILDIFLRDGALYFAVMALTNVANILTLYFAPPTAKGLLSTPASCISVTLCSRLVLNLYGAATPCQADSSTSPDEPMTTVMLTTCIELGMTVDEEDPNEVEQRAETHVVRQQRSTGPAKGHGHPTYH
ncbi:hypothetical protein BC826DRAFT_1104840 [Russula brevipes]|nr:hypothetical protein BC826DRAFT_1104840 [Russula brevipes]